MKRPNITPGPWKKRRKNGGSIICREDPHAIGIPLDVCRAWQSSFTEANAQAIAALPELLAALEQIMEASSDPMGLAMAKAMSSAHEALIQAGYTFD